MCACDSPCLLTLRDANVAVRLCVVQLKRVMKEQAAELKMSEDDMLAILLLFEKNVRVRHGVQVCIGFLGLATGHACGCVV